TLYSKPDGHSFIHALDLRTGLAHCIDLTLTGDFFALGSTALTLSPDQATLYLANPYLGRVMTIDLGKLEVTRVVRFSGLSVDNCSSSSATGRPPSSTLRPESAARQGRLRPRSRRRSRGRPRRDRGSR